jgi:hypothetical protein
LTESLPLVTGIAFSSSPVSLYLIKFLQSRIQNIKERVVFAKQIVLNDSLEKYLLGHWIRDKGLNMLSILVNQNEFENLEN